MAVATPTPQAGIPWRSGDRELMQAITLLRISLLADREEGLVIICTPDLMRRVPGSNAVERHPPANNFLNRGLTFNRRRGVERCREITIAGFLGVRPNDKGASWCWTLDNPLSPKSTATVTAPVFERSEGRSRFRFVNGSWWIATRLEGFPCDELSVSRKLGRIHGCL